MRTIQDMVQQELLCCMSSIVSTLAECNGYTNFDSVSAPDPREVLLEQAAELCYPIPDYEEAAIQEGWIRSPYESACFIKRVKGQDDEGPANADASQPDGWQRLCEEMDIDPYDREVYEHWAVTDWFADKLIEQGEKVDKDFGALCIWARTTTGQAISADGVVERIHAQMMQKVEA